MNELAAGHSREQITPHRSLQRSRVEDWRPDRDCCAQEECRTRGRICFENQTSCRANCAGVVQFSVLTRKFSHTAAVDSRTELYGILSARSRSLSEILPSTACMPPWPSSCPESPAIRKFTSKIGDQNVTAFQDGKSHFLKCNSLLRKNYNTPPPSLTMHSQYQSRQVGILSHLFKK